LISRDMPDPGKRQRPFSDPLRKVNTAAAAGKEPSSSTGAQCGGAGRWLEALSLLGKQHLPAVRAAMNEEHALRRTG